MRNCLCPSSRGRAAGVRHWSTAPVFPAAFLGVMSADSIFLASAHRFLSARGICSAGSLGSVSLGTIPAGDFHRLWIIFKRRPEPLRWTLSIKSALEFSQILGRPCGGQAHCLTLSTETVKRLTRKSSTSRKASSTASCSDRKPVRPRARFSIKRPFLTTNLRRRLSAG